MVQKVFVPELRGYNRTGDAMATGTKITRGLFGWWEELVQNKGVDLTKLLGGHKRRLKVWGTEVPQRGPGAEPQ